MSYVQRLNRPRLCANSSSRYSSCCTFKLIHLLKPRMLIIIALFFCWNLRNSCIGALHHATTDSGSGILSGLSYYHQTPNHPFNTHHRTITSNVRSRLPRNQMTLASDSSAGIALGGAGIIPFSDEGAVVGPIRVRSSAGEPSLPTSLSFDNAEVIGRRRKKDCSEPSIATRSMLGDLKRSYFAYSQDEVNQKIKDDEYRVARDRRKRDIQHQQLSQRLTPTLWGEKRSGSGGTTTTDSQDSPLPWTCETQYEWEDMGNDHYPRFVRTAKCKTKLCFNGFFRCRPRRYKTKVLKRINPGDSTSCEDDDVSMPETLRDEWKFASVTINLCCDCTGRMPGTTEV